MKSWACMWIFATEAATSSGKRRRTTAAMDELHRYGQRIAMEQFGWDIADFIREFGRNYLDEETVETPDANTFQILDEEIDVEW